MSLKGTVILYTDLVFNYQRSSYVVLDDYGSTMLVIEALAYNNDSYDLHVGQVRHGLDWSLDEWLDHGWEIIPTLKRIDDESSEVPSDL